MSELELFVPIIVAGGGACGAVAALAARAAGVDVLVIEQDDPPRGSTAMSQGLICAAGTKAQRAAGVEDDSADRYFDDIMAKTRGQTDPVLARAIADGAGACVDWLIDEQHLPYELDIRFRPAYGHTRARVHGWIGRGGEDLIQFLHLRLAETGADVLLKAKLIDIIEGDNGKIQGVVIERPGGEIEKIGCDALILATSGFGANHEMIARHMPEAANAHYHGHEGNTGLGITLGARVGGALGDMGAYQGYGMLADPQGISLPPGQMVEGGVLLNAEGHRFVHETEDIAGMVHPVLAQTDGLAWAIYDARIEDLCGYIPETQQLIDLNAAKSAASVEALAAIIGAPAQAIADALTDAHDAAAQGQPDAQGRVWRDDRPPVAPFRALRVRGALYHTQGGLQVDADARVLRADGSPLPNLFAGGGAARGVAGPSFWGYLPAIGLCAAVTLGRIAGQSAARLVEGRAS